MTIAMERVRRLAPLALGAATLAAVVLLLVSDVAPQILRAVRHDSVAAFSLAMIAFAYLAFQWAHRRPPAELAKAILLAVAFLFWAANQYWSSSSAAPLFNDIAIALFVLDVFLVIAGGPQGSRDTVFDDCCGCGAKSCRCPANRQGSESTSLPHGVPDQSGL